jgi:hypothetical protein
VPIKKAAEMLYEHFLSPKEKPKFLERCKNVFTHPSAFGGIFRRV